MNNLCLKKTRSTILYFPSISSKNSTRFSTETIVESLLTQKDHNLLVFDWREYKYVSTNEVNLDYIAKSAAEKILEFIENRSGYVDNESSFYFVGYLTGAHLAAEVARNIRKLSNDMYTIPRITAIDPAMPSQFAGQVKGISKECADYVDVTIVIAVVASIYSK